MILVCQQKIVGINLSAEQYNVTDLYGAIRSDPYGNLAVGKQSVAGTEILKYRVELIASSYIIGNQVRTGTGCSLVVSVGVTEVGVIFSVNRSAHGQRTNCVLHVG